MNAFAKKAASDAKASRPSPMDRLMSYAKKTGQAEVENPSHWQTYFKAQRLGLIDADGYITDAGRAYEISIRA